MLFFAILLFGFVAVFGLYTDYSTHTTPASVIPCQKTGDIFTQFFCNIPENVGKIKPHPLYTHWYIRCDQVDRICMPCPANLFYSERCDVCYAQENYFGDCPSPQPTAANPCDITSNACPAGPCSNYEYMQNANTNTAYCRCVHGSYICQPCPIGTIYDIPSKCCV